MSTVVVSLFTASDAYKADPSCADPGLKIISGCKGVLANYHGLSVDDGTTGYSIQVATSPEAFAAVVTNKELDPYKALVGPLTEISFATLKERTPEKKAKYDAIATEANKMTGGKLTYGWTGEDPYKAIVIGAWDSLEAHHTRMKEADAAENVQTMMELCDFAPAHVTLIKAS